jgi:hypothetical protein
MEAAGIHTKDGGYGMKLFFESRGYEVSEMYTQRTDNMYPGAFSFSDFRNEIDNNHPVLVQVAGHTMVGVGYNSTTNEIYIHDTWDYDTHSMTWGGSYKGMGLIGITVIHLAGGTTSGSALGYLLPLLGLFLFYRRRKDAV